MSPTPFRFIRKPELCRMLGLSRASIERLVSEKRLPRPCKLGARAIGWRSDEIEAYINNLPREEDAYVCRNKKSKM